MENKQFQRSNSINSSYEKEAAKKQNLKHSLEQQHQINQKKFQDPYFIQIGGGSDNENEGATPVGKGESGPSLKIVKQKRRTNSEDDGES